MLGTDGNPIRIPPGTLGVRADGTLTAEGEEFGKLAIVEFGLEQPLKKVGNNRFVARDEGATPSDPKSNAPGARFWLTASDPKLLDPNGLTVQFPHSTSHHKNWLEGVKARNTATLSPAPIAHCANTACIVSWVAMKTGRPLTWDHAAQRFVGDDAANAMLSRPERPGHGAFNLAKARG